MHRKGVTMQNFVNLNELPLTTIQHMIAEALAYKQGKRQPTQTPKLVANLFFENSTRTHTSFQVAETKLGWQRIAIDPQTSSTQKGETFRGTVITRASLADYLVRLIDDPTLDNRASVGLDEPGTDGDRPTPFL